MYQSPNQLATQFFLMDRMSPPSREHLQTIELFSKTEFEAIPPRWSFRCYGAAFQLVEKVWDPVAVRGTARFEVW